MSKQKLKQKAISIDLDEYVSCPHPEVVKSFREQNAEHMFISDTPAEVNERRVFQASKASKKPVRHIITALYRRKLNSKEYLFGQEEIISRDYFNNVVMHNRTLFRYTVPVVSKTYGLNPAMLRNNSDVNKAIEASEKEVSIESNEDVYEYEFEQIKPQLEEWYRKGIITDEQTKFYVWTNKKYSRPYSFREFMDLSIDDLVLLSNYSEKLSTAFQTDAITKPMLDALRKTIREELLTVPKVGAA